MLPSADSVLVAYSGGKDSLATLDICARNGKRIECFFMYFLPGMDYAEYWCRFAERRWGVRVRQYQHWGITYYLRRGVFRSAPDLSVPKLTILDIEAAAREDSGIEGRVESMRSENVSHPLRNGTTPRSKRTSAGAASRFRVSTASVQRGYRCCHRASPGCAMSGPMITNAS